MLEFRVSFTADLEGEDAPEGLAEALLDLPTRIRVPVGVPVTAWCEVLNNLDRLAQSFGAAWGVQIDAYVGAPGEEPRPVPADEEGE
jgi:hypothetical protein